MTIAIQGLGRMGIQIAHNRSPEPIDEAVSFGAKPAYTKEEVVAAFGTERVVLWIMLPADVVDQQLDEWLKLLPKGSIIVDGGNSDFRLTRQRNEQVKQAGMVLIDSGTSGGVWGYQNGFSMMVGGDDAGAVQELEPVFQSLAKPGGAFHHFGPSGSGHYVKMVHNAIEYGMMESLAEGYRMLKDGPFAGLDLPAAGDVWQHHSVITSWLNELSRDALRENPELTGIEGIVAESGEARWTLEVAQEKGIPLVAIQAAFDVRLNSKKGDVNFATKLLAAMRNKFGGHALNRED